jgi:hypothetical protein
LLLTLRLAAVLEFLTSTTELKSNKITDDEDNNKSLIEFRPPELSLIANKKLRIYSSASIAANRRMVAVWEMSSKNKLHC